MVPEVGPELISRMLPPVLVVSIEEIEMVPPAGEPVATIVRGVPVEVEAGELGLKVKPVTLII